MCEVCSEFSQLLLTCEARLNADITRYPSLRKSEVEVVLAYILSWPQRQCMCCYRDIKNFDRFNLVVQSILYLSVCQLKALKNDLEASANNKSKDEAVDDCDKKNVDSKELSRSTKKNKKASPTDVKGITQSSDGSNENPTDDDNAVSEGSDENEHWSMQQKEKLMQIVSKIFHLNFPLYIACKHSAFNRLDDISAQEISSLSCFCDLHDTELPVYLLRNVNLFCKTGGICAMTSVFNLATPENLPLSMAHAIMAAVGDIKLWLNYRAITQMFLPLRNKVLKYMCNLEDKDLRLAGVKTMADFLWSTIKDPLDTPITFDVDGLDLAFKYFTSPTLTMRLAGITQINTQISLFNEICASEPVPEAEPVGQQLAQWLCTNQIMQHLFGPNLHVEVIKHAHIILKFLAVENRITNEHIDLIWQAAQLKHCSKPVYDLLPVFIKNLAPGPCTHLYQLLCLLPPKEHTEQSLYLASALMRVMWSRTTQATTVLVGGNGANDSCSLQPAVSNHTPSCSLIHRDSSSEASVSMDPTNSDEDPCEELSTSGEEAGPTPRKQSKQQAINSDEKKWHQGNAVKETNGKQCRKRNKNGGVSSGSVSSGVEDLHHPPKKKVLRRRKSIRRDLFDIAEVELGELIESISDAEESSGSDPEICALPKNVPLRSNRAAIIDEDPSVVILKQNDKSPERACSRSAIHECPTICDSMDDRQLMELLSGDDGDASISSAMSNKSDKNMADFDGEESGCEEELARLAAQAQCMSGYQVNTGLRNIIDPSYTELELRDLQTNSLCARNHIISAGDCFSSNIDNNQESDSNFNMKIKDVCKPGNTLLWDLLQDRNIKQLGDGLALEAEKALYALLGFNTDKQIRFKFIEGCLENLSNHTSVAVSLRLLPKLFSSFQIRGLDMHQVVLWADREHHMMKLFFEDLKQYIKSYASNPSLKSSIDQSTNILMQSNLLLAQSGLISPLFSHITEVSVRLQFLTTIFSPMGSPSHFRLTLEQVDTLWNCLAHDTECSDCFFSWLSSHTKSTDQHALSIPALKYLYLEKMPTLNPETITIMGLSFYQQLCSLVRMTLGQNVLDNRDQSHPHVLAVDHLWKIALKAKNTDVSMGAIQYLNSYYMSQHLQQEEDFLSKCMSHLSAAAEDLKPSNDVDKKVNVANESLGCATTLNKTSFEFSTEEASLQCIQRALLLLKTHLDTFKRRYAYHIRRWAQSGASVCGSNIEGSPLKVIIQPGGVNVKASLDMHNTDYIADLRAQVTIWWEQQVQSNDGMTSQISDGPIRMITQGQELTFDFDEKTLYEMGFKDNQLVYLSVGGSKISRAGTNTWGDVPSQQPPPPRSMLPTLLLLKPQYFDKLFTLMQTLGEMTVTGNKGERTANMKAQLLSRRVWDILHAVPLNPVLLEAFENPTESQLPELLNPSSPQHLMYSLHIVSKLSGASDPIPSLPKRLPYKSTESIPSYSANSINCTPWSQSFITNGGLRHLYDILMSGVLQNEDGEDNEWQQDCLVLLLKLIGHLGVAYKNNGESHTNARLNESLAVPRLHESLLSLMDVEATTRCLMSILCEATRPKDPSLFKTGLWGRAQVVQHCMWLLVCWAHSSCAASTQIVCSPSVQHWLPRLLLEDPQPQVRLETSSALYRLCLGGSGNANQRNLPSNNLTHHVVPAILQQLLEHLPRAEGMRPCKIEIMHHHTEEGKEPYGPACKDYFWLSCQLVDGLPSDLIKENGVIDSIGLDLNTLCHHLTESLSCREIIERRDELSTPDDGLVGQLFLLTHLVKHQLPFKIGEGGRKLIDLVFGFLFDVAKPTARLLPKCKSQKSRTASYDLLIALVKGSPENYLILHHKLLEHHQPGPHSPYPWDYWPAEEGRSECGYVGLTNLGATCYMASCMQHLYMMPQARIAILKADPTKSKHQNTLIEMQKMFAYLLESERKAYNPRSFCKVYQMDHQPLNTGEQKDMAEFFIDLVSKLEEMTPELKTLVKTLFCGVLSNNVVSLDCSHVSRTLEEFYTVRCQVADMRNLYQSLDEVTVKDTLEGDNCYTCSQCSTKVRAEKRACFKKLPHILCFNTMRYTFNMVTMLKEKVNTHFSFPMKLDMSEYVEKHLMPAHYQEEKRKNEMKQDSEDDSETADCEDFNENYEYELIGVTVHTGTADGGHYYSFIKERNNNSIINTITGATAGSTASFGGVREKWLLFNDAEVKPFDPAQIASECFGGEMTSKTYDSATDKFMDFCFEKTNSAYMLFYERVLHNPAHDANLQQSTTLQADMADHIPEYKISEFPSITLSTELQSWIWEDNMSFLHQKNIFQHPYFTFMDQMCSSIPQSLLTIYPEVTEIAAQLSTSFFIETFIHAKEKPTMVSWVELVTKQFNASALASEWFLGHMASNTWWPMQVLIKCPNQMIRQMFQRLCIHVIQRLRSSHCSLYLQDYVDNKSVEIGDASCVTKFIKMLLHLMENGAKAHLRHLTEYFSLLYEFSKMGDEESQFLLKANAISMMVSFYLGHTSTSSADGSSSDDGGGDKLRPAALDKMVALVAGLVERSRDPHKCLNLASKDQNALQGGKGFPFLYQQTRDCLNLQQTKTLIHAMCRWNDRLAQHIISMIFQAISKHTESCQPFFKLLTLLVEGGSVASSGLPCFTQLALQQIWDTAESCPHATLEWLALQVPRNKMLHSWVLQTAESWVETYLLAHANQRVRSTAAFLLISLVPSLHFRQGYRSNMRCVSANKDIALGEDAYILLHQVYTLLLEKLKAAKKYIDVITHGPMKLTAYFSVLSYCLVSRMEKIMFSQYFRDLWDLFHPGLSEPSVAIHPNKQALLSFWHAACIDCPENIQLIVSSPTIVKHIAFNYILADHNDCEVVSFNRVMLPSYYAILRLCCHYSPAFTRTLSQHQNIHWAFKNITSHPNLYPAAIDELFRLMQLFATRTGDASEQELREVNSFRRSTLTAYLQGIYCQGLNGKTCWTTLISAFRTLVENDDDRLYIVYNGGLQLAFEAFHALHSHYHDVSGPVNVGSDLCELLALAGGLCRSLQSCRDCKEVKAALHACKDWPEALRRLATLLNTYNPPNIRNLSIALIKELLPLLDCIALAVLVPLLSHCHSAFQDARNALPPGPYFPTRTNLGTNSLEKSIHQTRPLRPMVQMCVPHAQLQAKKGEDPEYDNALYAFYYPYHTLLDAMCRFGVEKGFCTPQLISLVTMAACEAAPLQFTLFPTFWHEIYISENDNKKYTTMLLECRNLVEYIDLVLLDERETLVDDNVYNFFIEYFPKVEGCKVVKSIGGLIAELESKVDDTNINSDLILGDVRALEVLIPHSKFAQEEEMLVKLKSAAERLLKRTVIDDKKDEKDDNSVKEKFINNDDENSDPASSDTNKEIDVEKVTETADVNEQDEDKNKEEQETKASEESEVPVESKNNLSPLAVAIQNLIRIVEMKL